MPTMGQKIIITSTSEGLDLANIYVNYLNYGLVDINLSAIPVWKSKQSASQYKGSEVEQRVV